MCVNQSNTPKGSVQIKIGLWNLPIKTKGRPRKHGVLPLSSQDGSSLANLGATALPTRTRRGGSVIKGGRGSRGGRRNVGLMFLLGLGCSLHMMEHA